MKMNWRRRLYQLTVIITSLLIINGLSRGLIELSAQQKRLERLHQDLKKFKQEGVELKARLQYFRSDEYVETIARDKLLLAKEGETVLILPRQNENQISEIINHISPDGDQTDSPNWQKWAKLFNFL